MTAPIGTVQRAFELARTGGYASVAEIRAQLIKERFTSVNEHLTGPSLRRDLAKLCKEARAGVAQPEEGDSA